MRFTAAEALHADVHVYATTETVGEGASLASKAQDAALKRFGEGKVTVSARSLTVDATLKSFDLEALRAFD